MTTKTQAGHAWKAVGPKTVDVLVVMTHDDNLGVISRRAAEFIEAERDSLKAQRDELLEVLARVDTDLRLFMDADAVCDHSVNICWCEYNRTREAMRSILAKAKGGPA